MKNELENSFGKSLLSLVAHLIKNAEKVPQSLLNNALEFESFRWGALDTAEKKKRLAEIEEATAADSDIGRHIEGYPHPFTKDRYQDYLGLLQSYKNSLAG